MSVRRLAEDHLQPQAFAFNDAKGAEAKKWIGKYPKGREQSAVIPLLMLAQEQDGWVTKAAIEHVSDMLDMPRIRVLEVATFYTQFQLNLVGTRAHVQVCGTTPCMLRGSEELIRVCKERIHAEPFHLNAEGTLSWEEVECQGACVNAPMVMVFKDAYEDLTPARLAEIIDEFEAGRGDAVKTGPQIDRHFSAPIGGLTTLNGQTSGKTVSGDRKAARMSASKGNTTAKLARTAAKLEPKPAEKTAVSEGNSTMKVAATASGRAKAKASPAAKLEAKPAVKTAVSEGNATANVAATAAGRAKAKASPATKLEPKPAEKTAVSGGNPTMTGAATASGRAKAAAAPAVAQPLLDDKNRPAGIDRPAQPDDLKLISGVGPKIEGILHSLGIFTFAQVASWKKAEREWVDGYLRFKGRIDRDDWIKQAKALAKGGRDEYVRVFGKEPR
jgi:NADH-quinone oxidoreductase subunit E